MEDSNQLASFFFIQKFLSVVEYKLLLIFEDSGNTFCVLNKDVLDVTYIQPL